MKNMRLFPRLSAATFALLWFFSSLPSLAASGDGWSDFTIASPFAAVLTSPRKASVFTSTAFGFSIKYPQGWNTLAPPDDSILLLMQISDGSAAFSITGAHDLEDSALSDLTPRTLEKSLASLNVHNLKQVKLKLSDKQFAGKAFVGTQPAPDGSILKSKYVLIVRGTTLITFAFASTPPTFAKSVRSFDKTVASISAR